MVTSGTLSFKKPYLLKVDQRLPEKQSLMTDGQSLTIYSPAAGQVMTVDWKSWVRQTHFPVLLLSFVGDFPVSQWPQRYTILFAGYDQHLYKILCKPLQAKDSPVTLWVSDQTFLPVRGRLVDDSGTMDIDFKDFKMNTSLPAASFQLKIPAGTPRVPLSL